MTVVLDQVPRLNVLIAVSLPATAVPAESRFVAFKDANSDPAILSLTRAGQLSLAAEQSHWLEASTPSSNVLATPSEPPKITPKSAYVFDHRVGLTSAPDVTT